MSKDILKKLVAVSNYLGDPANDYVILGEGNTSAKINNETFWVKASGSELKNSGPDNFVQVYFKPLLAILDGPDMTDAEIRQALVAAKTDPHSPGHPSIETAFHAACLQLPDVNFIGHTHPTAVNMLTCSVAFEAAVKGRLFPDEIVVGGIAPLTVPYADPGLPLAREIFGRINRYIDEHGERPRVILMQNHGLIALASTAQQVANITAMAVKTARILQGTYAFGGPNFMTPKAIERIHTRPDEHYRQKIIGTGV